MSKVTLYRYSCDYCGKTIDSQIIPEGWYKVNSLRRVRDMELHQLKINETHLELCGTCAEHLDRFLGLLRLNFSKKLPKTNIDRFIHFPGEILVEE